MFADSNRTLLEYYSQTLLRHLLKPEIEEIAINQPGEIWLRQRKPDSLGRIWIPIQDELLSREYLVNLAHLVANVQNSKNFSPDEIPAVYGDLPGGHRFTCAYGHNIQYLPPDKAGYEGSICVNCRQYTSGNFVELQDYKLRPGEKVKAPISSIFTKENENPNDDYAKIINSLTRGDHILVSGVTSSGKTTFLNRLISYLDQKKRIVTVEDTRELKVTQPNRVHIIMSRTDQSNMFTYNHVRELLVRMTPDIILGGEISNSNAATIWNLMTTGHGHFMTTIHANNIEDAITTFTNCIVLSQANSGITQQMDRGELRDHMKRSLRIIQIDRNAVGARQVVEIH